MSVDILYMYTTHKKIESAILDEKYNFFDQSSVQCENYFRLMNKQKHFQFLLIILSDFFFILNQREVLQKVYFVM